MHTLKLVVLLTLLLAVMRAVSWAFGWLLHVARGRTTAPAVVAANGFAWVLFVSWLVYDLLPGEPFDMAPAAFAATVFTIHALTDTWWLPWRRG
jgi:hypothetical protein